MDQLIRIPIVSGELLKFFFNQQPKDLDALARDVTELQTPKILGTKFIRMTATARGLI